MIYLFRFVMQYFKEYPAPFEFKIIKEPPIKKAKSEKGKLPDVEVCEACYNLLSAAPQHFKEIWNWSIFIEMYSNHKNVEIKWLACQTLALLYDMSETEKQKLLKQTMSEEENRKFSFKYFTKLNRALVDPSSPVNNLVNEQKQFYLHDHTHYSNVLFQDIITECSVGTSKTVVDVEGVLLPCLFQVKQCVENSYASP